MTRNRGCEGTYFVFRGGLDAFDQAVEALAGHFPNRIGRVFFHFRCAIEEELPKCGGSLAPDNVLLFGVEDFNHAFDDSDACDLIFDESGVPDE